MPRPTELARPPGVGATGPAVDPGDREVVADAGDTGATGVADQALEALDLRGAVGAAEEDVVPEAGGEVLQSGEFEALGAEGGNEGGEFVVGPESVGGAVAPALAGVSAVDLGVTARRSSW